MRIQGKYWDSPVEVVGVPKGFWESEGEHYVRLEARGTRQENLLRYLSGKPDKEILLHLCEDPCSHLLWRDGAVHVEKAVKVKDDVEEWMSNAMAVRGAPGRGVEEDELAAIRAEQGLKEPGMEEELTMEDRPKKPRKEESRKEKREEKEKSSSSKKDRMRPKKDLEAIFGATGMDPDPSKRQRYRRKARKLGKKKKTKKKKESSSSGSHSKESRRSSSSEGSSQAAAQPPECSGSPCQSGR